MNLNIFVGFQKNEYILGVKILWIFLGDHHNIGLYSGVISIHLRFFFKVMVQNGEYIFSCQNCIFWGVFEIPDICLG